MITTTSAALPEGHQMNVLPRVDVYRLVHKGLRAFFADTLNRVGRVDATDNQDVADTNAQVRELLSLCRAHLDLEEHFLHPALESRQPGSSRQTAGDHAGHREAFRKLFEAVTGVDRASNDARAVAIHSLYQDLAVFVAENLEHMQVEESANNAVLWAHYTDNELLELQKALVNSIPMAEMAMFQRWMIPAITPTERAAILSATKRGSTAADFAVTLDRIRHHLPETDWNKLVAALAGA